MAQRFTLDNPPSINDPELRNVVEWVLAQLQKVENTQAPSDVQLEQTNVAPTKPVVGELRYADGTNWNPGGGAGMYEYTGVGGGNKWRMLASGVQY